MQNLLKLLLFLMLVAPVTMAADTPPPGARSEDMQNIVALCATQPESDAFKRAWGAYVETYHQPDAKLDQAIEAILAKASAYRQRRHAATGKLTWTAADREQARKVMQHTAIAVFRQMGG